MAPIKKASGKSAGILVSLPVTRVYPVLPDEKLTKLFDDIKKKLEFEPTFDQSGSQYFVELEPGKSLIGKKISSRNLENFIETRVNVETLKVNIKQFLDNFKPVMENMEQNNNDKFFVDTVEVGLELNGEGNVLVAKVGATASIRITFKRKSS